MSPTEAMEVRLKNIEGDITELKDKKASSESVGATNLRLDRLDERLNNLNQALLVGAIAWLVGSGMFLIAVLQLGSH